jgi:Protein of unknown function (DUF3048) N-terminal domain/Protein of unknown function (DUF3048) C-terminal domain
MKMRPGAGRVAALVAVSACAALVGGCGHSKHSATNPPSSTTVATTTAPSTTTTTTKPRPHAPVCPLTGTPPPKGKVPQRPALAVKVENLAQARPQWGLDHTDIVFEEPVEGGITRFIAVFQCHNAPRIEPVRSGRLVDPDILEPLGKMLFAYSGAIQPVVDKVDGPGSLLEDVGADRFGNAYSRDADRLAPHNLETSTAALWSAGTSLHYPETPPPPLFFYGPLQPGGTPVGSVHINFPLDITSWTWDAKDAHWVRSYSDTGPAVQGDNVQLSADNVVILHVVEYATPYVEDPTGAHENELTLTGTGPCWLFRNGVEFKCTWSRSRLANRTELIGPHGKRLTLTPGNTWEELVPVQSSIAVSP